MLARLNRLVKGQYVLFLISDYVICLFHHSYFIDETFDGGVANTQRLTGDFYRVFAGCMSCTKTQKAFQEDRVKMNL